MILRLIALMNSYSYGKSGGDIVFIEIMKRLKNINLTIITSELGKKLCQQNGIMAKYLITSKEKEFKNVYKIYFSRIATLLFSDIMRPIEGDILLGTSDFLPDVLPIAWQKLKNNKIKWVQHIFHILSPSRKIPFFFQKLSFFFIQHLSDMIIVDNILLKEDLIKHGFRRRKIWVNYPGIDIKYLDSVSRNDSSGYDAIFMAQIRPAKGIFDLIDIWKLVCAKMPKATLGIVGKGEELVVRELKNKIHSSKLDTNIDLLGFLTDEKAFAIMRKSKVFVFPSHEEGFGIAPLEAQALGLPVIAWNLPVFTEVFPEGMMKVVMGDRKEFAHHIITILRNESIYSDLSKRAIANATHYSWDKTATRENQIIKELMKPDRSVFPT